MSQPKESTITLPFRTSADKENAANFILSLQSCGITFDAKVEGGEFILTLH